MNSNVSIKQKTKAGQFGEKSPVLTGLSAEHRHPKAYHHLPPTPPNSTQLTAISGITFFSGTQAAENIVFIINHPYPQ